MSSYWSALFTSLITMALADYECLCNYNEETGVHSASQVMNLPDLGMLYEFDCKPTYQPVTGLHNWQAIQFEKQVVYIMPKCPYNVDPLTPHFNIVILGFTGVLIFLLLNIDCGYSLEPPH